jgi:hypothetical protein
MEYRPCAVVTKDGRTVDCVYIVPEEPYIKLWGVWPEDDRGKWSLPITAVAEIRDSDSRLPGKFANQLYEAAESGMGYCVFTVVFADGSSQVYVTGNAVDFIPYPAGKSSQDVIQVLPHKGRGEPGTLAGLDYHWCLYGGIAKRP